MVVLVQEQLRVIPCITSYAVEVFVYALIHHIFQILRKFLSKHNYIYSKTLQSL